MLLFSFVKCFDHGRFGATPHPWCFIKNDDNRIQEKENVVKAAVGDN
jgi:hypothetical protein